jgi:hypothetical protein
VCITWENVKVSCSEGSQFLSAFPSVKGGLKKMQREEGKMMASRLLKYEMEKRR